MIDGIKIDDINMSLSIDQVSGDGANWDRVQKSAWARTLVPRLTNIRVIELSRPRSPASEELVCRASRCWLNRLLLFFHVLAKVVSPN